MKEPFKECLDSLRAAVPLLEDAGIQHQTVFEVGNPYISQARNVMLRKALNAGAEQIMFIDHDVSFAPEDLLAVVQAEGEVVAGTYRFKKEEEVYMGCLFHDEAKRPIVREDGCIHAEWVPAGFLRVSEAAVDRFAKAYPHLLYGKAYAPHIDLFNHGAIEGTWYGEDYAFSKRFNEAGGTIWLVPNLNLTHHSPEQVYPGNFHNFLLRQPGGSEWAED